MFGKLTVLLGNMRSEVALMLPGIKHAAKWASLLFPASMIILA
jgi:hypothetical protein